VDAPIAASGTRSSLVEFRGLPELPRLLSNAPKTLFLVVGLVDGEVIGGEAFPFEFSPGLALRVRPANSEPIGASSGLELRSVPRVRPIPALEEDMRR
jgi:hypothetical protein